MPIEEHPFPAVIDKDPDSKKLPASLEWRDFIEAIGAVSITVSEWIQPIDPDGTLTVENAGIAGSITRCQLTGGTVGLIYQVTNRVTFNTGTEIDRSITVQVGQR